ncbi:MAG TPA: mycothiol system anti-sigma-R factor [Acidimicrobiia bacterium]|jgi:mycothiol system anti-sigma-R factor|nr:mycothiol system anti-sigma-R factor [Acidimicrobiia bacterium]
MDCDEAIVRLYQYLDGELTVWRRQAITRHLDECPPCAEGFDFEIELRQVIASKCRDEVPPALKRRIADAIGLSSPVPEEQPRGPERI